MDTSLHEPFNEDEYNRTIRGILKSIPFIDCGGFVITIPTSTHVTIPAGMSYDWHSHPYCEFSYIRAGEMIFRTREEILRRREGDVFFMPQGVEHRRGNDATACTIDGFMMEFHSTGGVNINNAVNAFAMKNHYTLSLPAAAKEHYASMQEEFSRRGRFMEQRIKLLIYDILYLMLSENFDELFSGRKSAVMDAPMRVFLAAKELIESQIAANISIKDISKALSLSPNYLSQMFRKAGELPCGKYIQERRLIRAYQMIKENPTMKIREVAESLGYTDELYFSRVFAKRFSLAPSAVRDNDPF
ncbi:MAG: AraC family transcriptional regulator [Spirochaetota bacterium]